MRLSLRPPLASIPSLLLLVMLAALVGGCSSDNGADADGPTVTATGPDETTDASRDPVTEATEATGPTGGSTDEPTGTASDLPDAVTAVCTPYSAMVSAIQEAASGSTDPDSIAAEIGPVMKEFAAQVPDLERPPGMSAETWRGVEALAAEIVKLPDHPTDAEIEAVEDKLSTEEREAVDDAANWFRTNCV